MKPFSVAVLLPLFMLSSVEACFNNPDFSFFYAGEERNCQNIRIDEFRRQELCSRFDEVVEECPQTCGTCCLDDPDYLFRSRKNTPINKPCSFVDTQAKRNKFCRKWSVGRMIRDACPVSCDFCQPAVLKRPPTPAPFVVSPPPTPSPSKPPSPSPTRAPTKSPTKAPTKAPTEFPTSRPSNPPRTGLPTPSPTRAPTKSPTKAPTKAPTASPTKATSAPTIVCLDDNRFVDNGTTYTCQEIRENESERQRMCSSSAVAVASCPVACGVCCRDDKTYSFTANIGTIKKCGWIGEERIRQNRYCNKRREGKLVKLMCPRSCNFCFEAVELQN